MTWEQGAMKSAWHTVTGYKPASGISTVSSGVRSNAHMQQSVMVDLPFATADASLDASGALPPPRALN